MIQRLDNWQRATSLLFSLLTDVFSRGSGIVPDLSEHKLRVDDDLVSELRDDGGQEAVAPGVDVVGAPEEVEQQPDHHQAEAVGVEHVLGGAGGVPATIQYSTVHYTAGHEGAVGVISCMSIFSACFGLLTSVQLAATTCTCQIWISGWFLPHFDVRTISGA